MEKRSITGRDILRMDGLLPPTRRLPVCDAVSSTSDKKKEKKWSIGGILKRISSLKDYDSSSNEEEMVYCRREPRRRTALNRKASNIILHPVEKNLDQYSNKNNLTSTVQNVSQSLDTLNTHRDSVHSRSSDGSLDGIGKRIRKNKLKARAEAKRDRICADTSSDEDSRKSSNSLIRFQGEDNTQNSQRTNSFNRKSRAARTERYIKRLSKDEGHGPTESLNDISGNQDSFSCIEENQRPTIERNKLFRPPIHPRRIIMQSSSHTFPVQRSTENLQETAAGLPPSHTKSSFDLTQYPVDRYIMDLNQNNTYAKPNILKKDVSYIYERSDNRAQNALNVNYDGASDYPKMYQVGNQTGYPPEPPPRDPRSRIFTYNCNPFPFNATHQRVTKFGDSVHSGMSDIYDNSRQQVKILSPCDSKNEVNWYGSVGQHRRRPVSLNADSTRFCNLEECTNNKHNSTGRHTDEIIFNETEAMKCQRRNNRNEQLNSNLKKHDTPLEKNTFPTSCKSYLHENSCLSSMNEPLERLCVRSPSGQNASDYNKTESRSSNKSNDMYKKDKKIEETKQKNTGENDSLEQRSSKNLEEALSELEAIYNSLRLGDEDLLDRAERRSMEEFSLKQGKTENTCILTPPDSLDRTKDDMAYRRMHPKERPSSLSDIVGKSSLSNISYLMASPILSRKEAVNDYLYSPNYSTRRDVPDVTRDDVVYRSISHANNTLKVVDPQPPFGIPLGPVATATESDYLHTTPTKPDHPRSLYIPQCEPDIVTDDLAYRALRKDANTTKNVVESKTDVTIDRGPTFGMKKKRAVRSLSANLYGLINHDRIHLRREPSLQEISDEMNDTVINMKSFPERSEHLRRVVSDGELSDYDSRWHIKNTLKSNTDINGNHQVPNMDRKKLRVYISPSTKVQMSDKENTDNVEIQTTLTSDTILPSKDLNSESWHDYMRSPSNNSSGTNKDTTSDFTAYTQLCQDLVNLVKEPDVSDRKPIKEEITPSTVNESIKIDDSENNIKFNESSILQIQSLGSKYVKLDTNTAARTKKPIDNEDIEELTKSITSTENEDPTKTEDNALDFYLRLADENVKLIAEAFSSVADHLRDSHLSQKNSLTSRRSEIENDSATHDASTRSSVIYSEDDANDEQSNSLASVEKSDVVPIDTTTIIEGDHEEVESARFTRNPNVDPELDLSKAVHDLQVAAASLCEHEKEIEELETRLRKEGSNSDVPTTNATSPEDECMFIQNINSTLEGTKQEQERDEEETIILTDFKARTDECDPHCEVLGL